MEKNNVLLDKSYTFALSIIMLCRELRLKEQEYELARQLLQAGTSVGANAEEAVGSQSRREFRAKISISYREARESRYWLRLLRDAHLIEPQKADPLIDAAQELLKITGSIQKTMKQINPAKQTGKFNS